MPFGGFAPLPLRLGNDLSAAQHARMCADLVAIKRTLPFAVITYHPTAGAGSTFETYGLYARNGVHVAPFPSGFYPGVTVNGTGDVTFTWANALDDDLGVSEGLRFLKAIAKPHADGTGGKAVVEISGKTVRVRTFQTGVARDLRTTLRVWT